MVKNPLVNARDIRDSSLIPGLGRSRGGGHGNPLQYSKLENPMDRGAQWSTVHGVAKSGTRLKQLSIYIYICVCVCIYKFIFNLYNTYIKNHFQIS